MLYLQGWVGSNCTDDVDECWLNDALCNHKVNSECNNTDGSFSCPCRPGFYEMDGKCFGKHCLVFSRNFVLLRRNQICNVVVFSKC